MAMDCTWLILFAESKNNQLRVREGFARVLRLIPVDIGGIEWARGIEWTGSIGWMLVVLSGPGLGCCSHGKSFGGVWTGFESAFRPARSDHAEEPKTRQKSNRGEKGKQTKNECGITTFSE